MFTDLGRIGTDIELKYTGANNTAFVKFSMAFDFGFGDKKRTEWLYMIAWGKTAEIIAKYCNKGDTLFISAEPQSSSWDNAETGKKTYKTEWNIQKMRFAGQGGSKNTTTTDNGGSTNGFCSIDEDDLPF